jgi:hypothetical protein
VPLTFYDGATGNVIAVPINGIGPSLNYVVTIPAHGTARVEIADLAAASAILGWAGQKSPATPLPRLAAMSSAR